MDVKHVSPIVEVKDEARGQVIAKFAQLNVIDHDGDVTIPGAFTSGQKVVVSAYGHDAVWGAQPAGKGVIREEDGWAVADIQFNMKTDLGRDAFHGVAFMDDQQEWSYGFDVAAADYGQHDGQNVRFLRDLDVFEVSPVTRGAGIGTHTVAAKDSDGGGLRFAAQTDQCLRMLEALTDRSKALAALRAKDGRVLSAANRDRLASVADGMRTHLASIDELIAATTPDDDPDDTAADDVDTDVDGDDEDASAALVAEQLRSIRTGVNVAMAATETE